jgi:lipid A 3-O-deacylase
VIRAYLSSVLLWIGGSHVLFAQPDSVVHYIREVSLTVDNDMLFFRDWYYTAGHELAYRRLVQPDRPIHKLFNQRKTPSKILIAYHYGNKIFTPREITARYTLEMDRPYAGWNYLGFSITRLRGLSTILQLETEVGVVGEMSGMGQIQKWWHKRVGYDVPRGWNSQIKNEIVVNMNYQLLKSFKIANELDLISHTSIHAGTGLNKVGQEFTLRMMSINSLTQSTFFNSRMGLDGEKDTEEIFIFISYGFDYIFSNIFLEGSLFDNPSPFTVRAKPWLINKGLGIMFSRNRSSFSFEIKNSSQEFANGKQHGFARIAYAVRF